MPDEEDEDLKRVEGHVRQLGEFYENVQILVSFMKDGETHTVAAGMGNWYARVGACKEFVDKDKAFSQLNPFYASTQDH